MAAAVPERETGHRLQLQKPAEAGIPWAAQGNRPLSIKKKPSGFPPEGFGSECKSRPLYMARTSERNRSTSLRRPSA